MISRLSVRRSKHDEKVKNTPWSFFCKFPAPFTGAQIAQELYSCYVSYIRGNKLGLVAAWRAELCAELEELICISAHALEVLRVSPIPSLLVVHFCYAYAFSIGSELQS